jgi:hypothetical protein
MATALCHDAPLSKTYHVMPEHTTCLGPASPGQLHLSLRTAASARRSTGVSPLRGPPGELLGADRATRGAGRTRLGVRRAAPLPQLPPTTVERSESSIQLAPLSVGQEQACLVRLTAWAPAQRLAAGSVSQVLRAPHRRGSALCTRWRAHRQGAALYVPRDRQAVRRRKWEHAYSEWYRQAAPSCLRLASSGP